MFLFGGGSFTIKVAGVQAFQLGGFHQPPYMISKVAGGRGGVLYYESQ